MKRLVANVTRLFVHELTPQCHQSLPSIKDTETLKTKVKPCENNVKEQASELNGR